MIVFGVCSHFFIIKNEVRRLTKKTSLPVVSFQVFLQKLHVALRHAAVHAVGRQRALEQLVSGCNVLHDRRRERQQAARVTRHSHVSCSQRHRQHGGNGALLFGGQPETAHTQPAPRVNGHELRWKLRCTHQVDDVTAASSEGALEHDLGGGVLPALAQQKLSVVAQDVRVGCVWS